MGIQLWHVRFNLLDCVLLTALVVATTPTVVSLFLGRYVRLICRELWIEHLLLATQEDSVKAKESRRYTAAELDEDDESANAQKDDEKKESSDDDNDDNEDDSDDESMRTNQTRTPRRSETHSMTGRQLRQKMMMTKAGQSGRLRRRRLFVTVAATWVSSLKKTSS
jgi:hypothetical protein